jgi:hypothetical protein
MFTECEKSLKDSGNENFMSHLKEHLKLSAKSCYRFFISSLTLEIFD